MSATTIAQLNAMDRPGFVQLCGGFYEHSPWIAERVWELRPFTGREDLLGKMMQVITTAGAAAKLALIRAHPDLVGRLAKEGRLTAESTTEQAAAGLTHLTQEEASLFERYNAAYRERFDFPFIICARENKKAAILAAFPERLKNDRDTEVATALEQINRIARLRIADAITEN